MSRICFSLDVLTDGSEFTGHGTLFLSVWRKPKTVDPDDDSWLLEIMKTTTPLARYAISGLGDATARLCADQRLKLAPTRAIFLPCSTSWDGLSAMLLALHSAGAPSLHVITTPDSGNRLEELAEIILGRHRGFNIPTCEVPLSSQGEPTWWKVYEDEYLVVHGSCRRHENEPPALNLLYTLFEKEDARTFLLIPPGCRHVNATFENIQKEKLPIHNDIVITIDCVIALDPSILPEAASVSSKDEATMPPFLVTTPNQNEYFQDPGVLIRAQQVAQVFHEGMPWAFPYSSPHSSDLERLSSRHESGTLALRSCTSLIVDFKTDTLEILDRRAGNWTRVNRQDWSSTLESLTSLIPKGPSVEDENEIELDDDDEDDDENNETQRDAEGLKHPLQDPHLIVLGTGCASPSALRGASGYAVVFPKSSVMYPNTGIPIDRDQVVILDCGEGVATMLSRHGGSRSVDLLPRIAGIWISHTHLDHYGGLPTLLRAIFETSQQGRGNSQQSESSSRSPKQSRLDYAVPWVMAPAKVLRFLDIVLQCHRGRHHQGSSSSRPMFLPRTHDDPTVPPGPWSWFQNIKVYHSCCPSFGILLGWLPHGQKDNDGRTRSTSFLCYSGDTRPCRTLVQVCQRALATTRSRHMVLLHEATFQEEEQESAEKKKHATVAEAIQVGRDIPASETLLSHFSQRYVSLTKTKEMGVDDDTVQSSSDYIPVGLAMDGLWLPLTAK
jgi:ribonuclease BN (tRNA processing enzyme)